MPTSYHIDRKKGLAKASLSGVVHDLEFVRLIGDVLNDPEYRMGMNSVLDLSQVTEFLVNSEVLQKAAGLALARLNSSGIPWRTAIIAPGDLTYGFSHMYQILREDAPEHIEIFRDITEARNWLGLQEE